MRTKVQLDFEHCHGMHQQTLLLLLLIGRPNGQRRKIFHFMRNISSLIVSLYVNTVGQMAFNRLFISIFKSTLLQMKTDKLSSSMPSRAFDGQSNPYETCLWMTGQLVGGVTGSTIVADMLTNIQTTRGEQERFENQEGNWSRDSQMQHNIPTRQREIYLLRKL